MQGITEVGGRHLTAVDIVTVTLVDDDTIADFHDTTLDALQLIARTSHLDKQEKVDHRVASRFTLPHSNGLNENLVEACGLTQDDGLTRLTGHTAKRACRRTRADERRGMLCQLLHARLIAKDTALGTLAGRVNGQHGELTAMLLQHMNTKFINRG